ncbi:hypothetical protein C8Q76DRAFT_693648 [Earliella scabrosa]|nr:hypothetical protein C8Q76DRAFT_693648 [Earliella scabrosa]
MSSLHRVSPFEHFLLSSPASVIDNFFARWPVDLIFRIRCLSVLIFLSVESYRTRVWNPTTVLQRYFSNVPRFLHVLDLCDGIVSGSQALQLLQRSRRIGNLSYPSTQSSPQFTTFHFIRTIKDEATAVTSTLRVQLVVVQGHPLRYLVDNFHSTAVMNYFTGRFAVSLFPRSTFVDRVTYTCREVGRASHDWITKYHGRGFEVVTAGGVPTVEEPAELSEWQRWVGDSLSWVLPFAASASDMRGVVSCPLYNPKIRFEVLPYGYAVAPTGAYLRVGPPFVYSAMAYVSSGVDVSGTLRSPELQTVFSL